MSDPSKKKGAISNFSGVDNERFNYTETTGGTSKRQGKTSMSTLINERWPDAVRRENERASRKAKFGPLKVQFEDATKLSRYWHRTAVANSKTRNQERSILNERIAQGQLKKEECEEKFAIMDKADREFEEKFGGNARKGEEAERKLKHAEDYLLMKHDEVPDLEV